MSCSARKSLSAQVPQRASSSALKFLSAQVLGVFYVAATRKLAKPLSRAVARQAVDGFCTLRVEPLRAELVRAAVDRSESSKLSYWDALIVETAIAAGAGVLFTEDLQQGRRFGRLRIVNPFQAEP